MDVREALGYSASRQFIAPHRVAELPPSELTFALRLAFAECPSLGDRTENVQFGGAYVLQRESQTPAVPVVYVVHTASDAAARQVHRFVWNQNQTPFLIVESPSTIRIYPGFTFERDGDHPLVSVAKGTADILSRLTAFRAESIDDGTIWRHWAHAVDPMTRVDEALLRDLGALDKQLQRQGVSRKASHGLIGKYVYLWYLRDRDILSDKKLTKWGISPQLLFTDRATLSAFQQVDSELQGWLNGAVFSLGEAELSEITEAQLQVAAGVFRGGSPVGASDFQPSLFDAYDFSHIPIETLSCVYEQFLHDAKEKDGTSRGKTLGAYYTPLPLADYVLSELERRKPLKPGMKVLDPACGSGAFLVQCYRRLIEKQRRIEGRDLKKSELRDLLTRHIFGIDRDDDACRIAELSLILTLLDYVEPPDLEDTTFKLPYLRGRNIFGPSKDVKGSTVNADFFDASGPVHEFLSEQQFDWIVGNPPWAEVKKTPGPEHEHFVVHQWMKAHKQTHPTSGNQIAEAFLWKAGEHLETEGVCGLVVLAMTWFKKEAAAFRQRFFSERRVWCLANFANLAYVLFAGRSERPASVVFFDTQKPGDDHTILTFAPFVAEQIANRPEKARGRKVTWNIVVNGTDVREIENTEACLGDSLTWKIAMWGTSRDHKLLNRLGEMFDTFHTFASRHGLFANEGPRIRSTERSYSKVLEPHKEIAGKNRLDTGPLRGMRRFFAFPETAIKTIRKEEANLPKGEAQTTLRVCQPPLISVDAARRFAVFSADFLATPAPNIGISGELQDQRLLIALSLFLSSDYCVYDQFFRSRQWGIDASRSEVATLRELPVPFESFGDRELNKWTDLQEQLVASTRRQFEMGNSWEGSMAEAHRTLVDKLNELTYSTLKMRTTDRWLVQDFVDLHLGLNKGKLTREAIRLPTLDEQKVYLVAIRDILDGFLSEQRGVRHKIEVVADSNSALLAVSLVRAKAAIQPIVYRADEEAAKDLAVIRDRLLAKHSQWVYFERGLRVYEPGRGALYQFKPLQRLHWTRRQAVLDADDIIAETLVKGGQP